MNKKIAKKMLSLFLIITFVFSAFGIIKATADTTAFTLTDATIKEKSDKVESDVSVSNGSVTNNLTFHKVNDYIVYKLTFKNNDSKDYVIKGISDNNSNEHIKYEYDQYANETIKAGETKDILVKVTYVKEVTDITKRNTSDPVKLSFEIEDVDGNKVVSNVTVNPKTNDGIAIYIGIAAVSVIGLAVLLLKNKKSGKLLVMLALVVPFAVKAAEASFIITLKGELKLHDKVLVTTTINGVETQQLINYEDKFTKPADPEIDGQEFLGWFIGDEKFNFDKEVADDVELVSKFKPIEYTVTFDPTSGKVATESIKFTKGQKVVAPVPFNPDDATFLGWYDIPESEGATLIANKKEEFTPSGNVTLYAHWDYTETEPNLIDKDNDNNISEGDIVNFGPEEFVVIGIDGSLVKLLALRPLGDVNGVKQASSNLISSKYSDTAYWVTTAETASGWPISAYHIYGTETPYDGGYYEIPNYGETNPEDVTKEKNLVYGIVEEYYDYLNDFTDMNIYYIHLPMFKDLYAIGCRVDEANSCPDYIGGENNFWLGSSVFPSSPAEALKAGTMGYMDVNDGTIKLTEYTDSLNIRPVIWVETYEIITPWN